VTHDLKTEPKYFDAVKAGLKTVEIRQDDRWFEVGDWLKLHEWVPMEQRHTGNWVRVKILEIYRGDEMERFGLMRGYCVMVIRVVR